MDPPHCPLNKGVYKGGLRHSGCFVHEGIGEMASQSSINKTILPNGVRILSERVPYVDSVSVGVWAVAGARDEDETRHGMSHFVEHMVFKGTKVRSARQIADEMDSLGGHLNAFTDKEFTCYYAKVLGEHLPTAMDVVSDMVLNSVYDPVEISREINVVLEEIKRHQDTPRGRSTRFARPDAVERPSSWQLGDRQRGGRQRSHP